MQQEFSQLDAKLDVCFQEMQMTLKGELQSLLDQYIGQPSPVVTPSLPKDKSKGILGEQPSGFPPREAFMVLPYQKWNLEKHPLGVVA